MLTHTNNLDKSQYLLVVTTSTPGRIPAEFELDRNARTLRMRRLRTRWKQARAFPSTTAMEGGKTGQEYAINRTDIYTLNYDSCRKEHQRTGLKC